MIAVLFAESNGVYAKRPGIDLWDRKSDARKYRGPNRVICHSPCGRWGRYAEGQPGVGGFILGDDGGCFAHALWCVRTFGGVLEHPAGSGAWPWFGLPPPGLGGWWGPSDSFGGATCRVDQGHYGHVAPKATWLYAKGVNFKDLIWGPSDAVGRVESMGHAARLQTPPRFRDALIEMVSA